MLLPTFDLIIPQSSDDKYDHLKKRYAEGEKIIAKMKANKRELENLTNELTAEPENADLAEKINILKKAQTDYAQQVLSDRDEYYSYKESIFI